MIVPGERLSRVCQLLSLCPTTPGIPGSSFIAMVPNGGQCILKLSSSVSVSVPLEGQLEFPSRRAIDRRILFPFIHPEGEYNLSVHNDKVVIRQGSRVARIRTVAVDW